MCFPPVGLNPPNFHATILIHFVLFYSELPSCEPSSETEEPTKEHPLPGTVPQSEEPSMWPSMWPSMEPSDTPRCVFQLSESCLSLVSIFSHFVSCSVVTSSLPWIPIWGHRAWSPQCGPQWTHRTPQGTTFHDVNGPVPIPSLVLTLYAFYPVTFLAVSLAQKPKNPQ